ncbi:MAG: pyridoxal phosphate-dependent aminotransferase [Defluviitaleaceae bacterium]|nr:pyridoxal phosphate-dependent aminotransferase [Defluviitaleaceae bacterium]
MHDFDKVLNRQGTYSMKYDTAARGKPEDVLPMWVADMDFAAPPCVAQAMAAYSEYGVYGYAEPDAAYFDVVQDWFVRRFGWHVQREWLVITPGVVNALYVGIRAFTEVGDGVLIQQPVYYPFELAIRDTKRTLLVNPLVYENGQYTIDFEDFEAKAQNAKLFILCSPHNPVGRVWTQDELARMGEICLRHGVTVIADEIWQDLVYEPHKHTTFATLSPQIADITVTATAPSKTFNLAGLQLANIFASNAVLHRRFKQAFNDSGLHTPSLLGLVSCKAAYKHGEPWLNDLLAYLSANLDYLRTGLNKIVPAVKPVDTQGTYLAWLDCSGLAMTADALDDFVTNKAKLWLSDGQAFGVGGDGFIRINIACPRATLKEAFQRLENAIKN